MLYKPCSRINIKIDGVCMRRSSSADVFFEQWSVNRARTVSLLRLAQFDTELHSTTIAFWGDFVSPAAEAKAFNREEGVNDE